MEIRPILSALMRSKTGAILVAVQVALSLAILANALHIVNVRQEVAARPSGVAAEGGRRLSSQPRPTIKASTSNSANTAPNRLGVVGACCPTGIAALASGAAAVASMPVNAVSECARWG